MPVGLSVGKGNRLQAQVTRDIRGDFHASPMSLNGLHRAFHSIKQLSDNVIEGPCWHDCQKSTKYQLAKSSN